VAAKTTPSLNTLNVERLLRPRSVAIVGAAPEPGSIGGNVLANLERFGYSGEIHLVSRTRKEINGRRCVPAIDDLRRGIDAVVLVVPEAVILDALAACVRREAGSAVVFTSGFAETGEEGRRKQEQLAAIARDGGLILNGPNCMGVTNYVQPVSLTFDPCDEPAYAERGAGLIAQSGGLITHIRLALRSKGVPLTCAISTGNEAVVGIEDFLAYLIEDESTRSITLFVEQVRRPAAFLELVRRARTRQKPVVLMHPGRTQRARESSQSHTGALAGSYAVMAAALRQEGVIQVDTLDELIDVSALLAKCPIPAAPGLAILTNSGAFKGVAFDFCEELGLDLPELGARTRTVLQAMLPPFAPIENPLDLTTATISQPAIYGRAAEALLDDPGAGALLLSVITGPLEGQSARFASLLPVIARAQKPVVFAPFGDDAPLAHELIGALCNTNALLFRSADRALRALARLDAYGRTIRAPEATGDPADVPKLPLPNHGLIPEHRAKQYLAAAGIATPKGALAQNVADAQAISARIGYPVVLKAQAGALTHKTDAGGVITGIADPAMLATQWEQLQRNLERFMPGLHLEGVLVEQMAPPGLEMILGARRDPEWGPVLMIGLGGIWTEALNDVRLLPANADEATILAEIRRLKGAALLTGLRGSPRLNAGAAARTLFTLGGLMRAIPELMEIEINPLRVYAERQDVLALDALMNIASE
jgi:acyl-CoA synthetase (NDP forming)